MSDKRKRQVTGKLITSGLRSGFLEAGTSPTTPLEFTVLSPTGIIKCDMGGIGLGIVAALEQSNENIPAKKTNFRYRNPMESEPIPVKQARNVGDVRIGKEEYKRVTHQKLEKPFTEARCVTRKPIKIREQPSIFDISPARFSDDNRKMRTDSEILSTCHLCNKRLHGKDVYMYREKPFCSPECRSRRIGMDERREKHCSSQASSSPSNVTSPQVLSTGIFAI